MLERSSNPERQTISLKINGVARDVATAPFSTLADTLRGELRLTGTKIGCDAGDCGACTVIMNGEQVCACLVAAAQADGAEIVTIEGRDAHPLIGPLQDAFLAHGAAQCGICTPGMIMAAADLLSGEPSPSRGRIADVLGGVLCRCTGYQKIIDAVEDVAQHREHPAPPSDGSCDDRSVGQRLQRLDGRAKVDGSDRFGADEIPYGALFVRLIRSPHAHARFTLGDLDGFIAKHDRIDTIVTARDVPGHNGFGIFPHLRHQPVLAESYVRYRGEPVLALVGRKDAVNAIAADTLPITWQPLEPLDHLDKALSQSAPALHDNAQDNVLTRGLVAHGDAESALAHAAATVEGTFSTSFVEHAYIEPEAGAAWVTGQGDQRRVVVRAATQAPYMDRDEVATVLGIAPERVRIIPTACGGGFGGKLDVLVQPVLAVAAWKTGKPVHMVLNRIESMAASTKRHPARIFAQAAADASGRLVAYLSDADFDTGAYASWGPTVAGRVPVHAAGPYHVPHVRNRSRAIYTNQNPSGAFRGFGVPQAAIAHETLMDDLAERLALDRLEIRHINALRVGQKTATGQVLTHSAGLAACLDALRADWHAMLREASDANVAAQLRGGKTRSGVGIGCMWYGCGNTALPNPSTMRITLDRTGKLTFFNGAVDIGQGSTTVLTQICADALGLPVDRFSLVLGDTDLTADAGKTSASRQTFVSGKAAELAGRDLRRKILALSNAGESAVLKLQGCVLDIADGETLRRIDLSTLPEQTDGSVLSGSGTYDPPTTPLDAQGQGTPYATYGFAAQIALADVNLEFGTVKVRRITAAHDVGKAINPTLVEGQIHGGIAQGLGLALMEEFIPGRTENLHDYLIPTFGDMPHIDIKLIEDPEAHGPFGAKGIGEPALIPTAPAILGAIRHATGVTIRHVPVLPHRLWAALRESAQ